MQTRWNAFVLMPCSTKYIIFFSAHQKLQNHVLNRAAAKYKKIIFMEAVHIAELSVNAEPQQRKKAQHYNHTAETCVREIYLHCVNSLTVW